jgi:hypothetical protein
MRSQLPWLMSPRPLLVLEVSLLLTWSTWPILVLQPSLEALISPPLSTVALVLVLVLVLVLLEWLLEWLPNLLEVLLRSLLMSLRHLLPP